MTCGETAAGFLASLGHSHAFFGPTIHAPCRRVSATLARAASAPPGGHSRTSSSFHVQPGEEDDDQTSQRRAAAAQFARGSVFRSAELPARCCGLRREPCCDVGGRRRQSAQVGSYGFQASISSPIGSSAGDQAICGRIDRETSGPLEHAHAEQRHAVVQPTPGQHVIHGLAAERDLSQSTDAPLEDRSSLRRRFPGARSSGDSARFDQRR